MFFNFLNTFDQYDPFGAVRMNLRYHMMVNPFAVDVKDACVFDLAVRLHGTSLVLRCVQKRQRVLYSFPMR